MNLRVGIAAIIISTCCLLGLFYAAIYQASNNSVSVDNVTMPTSNKHLESPQKIPENPPKKGAEAMPAPEKSDDEILRELVLLSDEALHQEFAELAKRIKENNYFSDLEAHKLQGAKATEAKRALERFSLLSIEGTRRKYAAIEPELNDPVYAHQASLKDIRKTLDRY